MFVTNLEETEFRNLIFEVVKSALSEQDTPPQTPEPFIKGIHELAKFLRCSPARAQKLKNEGIFPYFQDNRTLLFDRAKVRTAMNSKTK
ncbi:MAG: hypothetical protein A2W85_06305 [Bacteroidetes bacterium GWF2_41_31]|nr:MAG: hypothetical protein A2W85_06305 [Bacteroidetes bacterium GWF2_41_31]